MTKFVELDNPILRQVAQAVPAENITSPFFQGIIDEMIDFSLKEQKKYRQGLSNRKLAGLAAPQIGIPLRIMLVDLAIENGYGLLYPFINPEITRVSQKTEEAIEGCFSVDPRICGMVSRPKVIGTTAYNMEGEAISREYYDKVARVFQHEREHLDGILFVDKAEELYLLKGNRLFPYRLPVKRATSSLFARLFVSCKR